MHWGKASSKPNSLAFDQAFTSQRINLSLFTEMASSDADEIPCPRWVEGFSDGALEIGEARVAWQCARTLARTLGAKGGMELVVVAAKALKMERAFKAHRNRDERAVDAGDEGQKVKRLRRAHEASSSNKSHEVPLVRSLD